MDPKGKKVTVVGLARSGIASANLLYDLKADVYVTELNDTPLVRDCIKSLRSEKIKVELGIHSENFIRNSSLVIISPGVSDNSKAVSLANEFNIPIISELELAYRFCKGTIIAITGTNGKTTVTTLSARVLASSGKNVLTLGNIGTPFTASVLDIKKDDYVCLEVSSFQLERIVEFKPRVSVFLNFTSDHLDRYKDIEEYLVAKKRIFMNQDINDFAILNYSDPTTKELSRQIKAKIIYFNTPEDNNKNREKKLNPNEFAIIKIASIFGIKEAQCIDEFKKFKGIEHRMEFVRDVKGVEFINDSKATNVDSTIWALNNSDRPLILIAGGKDKNSDYTLIKDLVSKKVKNVIVIGQAKEKIKMALNKVVKVDEAETLAKAVNLGLEYSSRGDIVLFSPMCSSFDMFDNYEHRGRVFKDIVNSL